MRSSLYISSLLPLLLLSFFSAPCSGQDSDPLGGTKVSSKPLAKPFADQPQTAEIKRPKVDADSLDVSLQREKKLEATINELREQNEQLKTRANELDETVAELTRKGKEAVEIPQELHQTLFDSLLFSEDKSFQELALKHLIACIEKDPTALSHTSLHSVDVHRRLKLLTSSKTETVREMAAGCLYVFHPSDAAEMGIQFSGAWKPLEHFKCDHNTHKIHDALARPYDMMYDEMPLIDVVEEIQRDYGIGVRLAEGIAADQAVTFESVGRTLTSSLAGMLESRKLGFAVKDEELRIMKITDPALKVVSTYNVSGLDSLAQIKTDAVLKTLKEAFEDDGVEFAKVGEHLFTAKTDFKNQRKIQERIAALAPPPKWYSR